MREMKMSAEMFQHKMFKLHQKRNVKFRAFFINLILIIVAWLICMSPACVEMMQRCMPGMSAEAIHMYMMTMLGIWKIGNVAFFLSPALAFWWEMHVCKKSHQ
jgi:hypothetical protein